MKLSIIIPVFNSEKILKHLINSITQNLTVEIIPAEIILINDFSSDNSWEIIKELSKSEKIVKGINLKTNYGQHAATFIGLKYSLGDRIICMDDDMQHDPKYIKDIFTELKDGFDVCYVKYQNRKHSKIKIFISWLNHIFSSYLMKKSSNIYMSSFKGFNSDIKNKILQNTKKNIFLDYMIMKEATNINSIYVKHQSRFYGETNYKLRQLITLWSKMIFSIDEKKFGIRYLIIKLLQFIFIIFLKNYIKLNDHKEVNIKSKTF